MSTHIENELPHMVDVSNKTPTKRQATVLTIVYHTKQSLKDIKYAQIQATLNSIIATKTLPQFIPLTHPIPFTYINTIAKDIEKPAFKIETTVKATWYTGMEVESYLGSLIYALAFAGHQDKAAYHFIIRRSMLIYKSGGKSGTLKRSMGKVEDILLSEGKSTPFVVVKKSEKIYISNSKELGRRYNAFPLILTNITTGNISEFLEIGPHIMLISYKEFDENNNFLLMLTPNCDIAVIRKNHNVTSPLMEE